MLKFQRQMEIFISDVENLLKNKKKICRNAARGSKVTHNDAVFDLELLIIMTATVTTCASCFLRKRNKSCLES